MTLILEQITSSAKLLSLPNAYIQLKTVLDSSDYVMGDVANIISGDPAMTARLLQLVNSSYFGLPARIETVSNAVNMLGTQQVHDLVLATSVAKTFDGMTTEVMDMQRFWRNSIYCAVASRLLAIACHALDSERLFVAGLLRDIGHLVMYQSIPDLSQQCIAKAEQSGTPLFEVEQELIGLNYAMVGGTLLQQWGLPKSLYESTALHVKPRESKEYPLETSLIHIATNLTNARETENELDTQMLEIDSIAWTITGLSPDQCIIIQREAELQVDSVVNLMFPKSSVGN